MWELKSQQTQDVESIIVGLMFCRTQKTKHLDTICTMLDKRRRRWADVVQNGMHMLCISCVAGGSALNQHCFNVSCSLHGIMHSGREFNIQNNTVQRKL